MLLICPVRPGDNNEELRYALRSWEENLILHDGLILWTVGYQPSWLNPDFHIEGNRFTSMPLAVFDNIRLASELAMGTVEEAVYMNDDFFCLDPTGSILPVRRDCTLAEHLRLFPKGAGLWWPRSLALTASWLAEQGFPDPNSFEVHRPLLASPGGMFKALSQWDMTGQDMVPQWRTMYGVINHIGAYPVGDAKLDLRSTGFGSAWVSTSDQSWRRYSGSITKRFQKPSRWEL